MAHDFFADEFDTIDGKHYVYNKRTPENRREVVELLDFCGEPTDDPEEAAGGVVQVADECFVIFMWNA